MYEHIEALKHQESLFLIDYHDKNYYTISAFRILKYNNEIVVYK